MCRRQASFAWLAGRLVVFGEHVGAHEEHLRGHEDEGEAEDAEHLEGHPEVGRLSTPDRLVQGRHGEEEKSKAQRELVPARSEEHTSELQSLMRISYAVFCLKKKNTNT